MQRKTGVLEPINEGGNKTRPNKAIAIWLRLTAPAGAISYETAPSRLKREKLRRAGLTSYIAPFVFFAPLLLAEQANNPATFVGIITLMAVSCLALLFNRFGKQSLAAFLLIVSMDLVIEGSLVSAGTLSSGWLLTFDLFTIPLMVSGVLLSRQYVWIFMLVHVICILGDFFLMPHSADLQILIQVWHGPAIVFARPLLIQVGISVLSYVEIRSTDEAVTRAEKAEFVTKLQNQIQSEKIALEQGIQEIIRMLVSAANGNYTVQPQMHQENILWQIVRALNTLFSRLQHAKQNELMLNHEKQEILRLLESIRAAKRGQSPLWPQPSGGLLDPLLLELRGDVPAPSQFSPSSLEKKSSPASRTLHGVEDWSQQKGSYPTNT